MARRRKQQAKGKTAISTEIKEVSISSLAHDGRGVGRDEQNKVVFVDGALPDETVRYQTLESHKRYSKGKVVEILKSSTHRVEPKCDVFGKCGGCALQHLNEDQQIIYKQQQLIDNLQKIGEVTPDDVLAPIVGDAWSYRRRARFGAAFAQTKKEVRLGFRARNSHFVQPTPRCDIVDTKISALLPKLREVLSGLDCNDSISGVEICIADGATVVVILYDGMMLGVDSRQLMAFAQQCNLQLSIKNGAEDEHVLHPEKTSPLSYEFNNLIDESQIKLEFLSTDFTQVNDKVNALLVKKTLQLLELDETDHVLDLFCGIGNFTLPLASQSQQVTGVEGDAGLIARAKHNQAVNEFDNAGFYVADLFANDLFEGVDSAWTNQRFDKIVLDPPRAGAAQLVKNIDRFEAEKIVYISCDPATLARDANVMVNQHGYRLIKAGIADMFPQTAHVESIAVFEA